MPLQAPVLDDRSYEQIFELVRARIPRYTPEWTDFNDSDPGITLIQLFSWLTEMILYQTNRLPDRNYIKFLKLLNMELRPPLPAVAHLSFLAQANTKPLPVVKGSQIAAQSVDTGELIVFETDEGMDLIPYALNDVQVYDGAAFAVLTESNQVRGQAYNPFGWAPQPNSALYLGFALPQTLPQPGERAFPQQIRLRVFLPAAAQAGEAQTCGEVSAVPPAPVRLVWEYRHPKAPFGWRQLTVFDDQSVAFTREGYIVLEGPAELAPSKEGKITEEERYWLRCRIDRGNFPAGTVPEIDFVRPNTVSATALSTVRNEVLGQSEGHPDQTFAFRKQPVAKDSLVIRTEVEDRAPEYWEQVEDFLASGPDDPHYVLNASAGQIQFGNGIQGRIPVAGQDIVAELYRHGGGDKSNVPADSIALQLTTLTGVESVNNERPAVGGKDEQDLEEFKAQAPLAIRNRNRAVTPDDFAALALQVGGVSRAKALPLWHPGFPGVDVPGAITVVIVPDNEEHPPEPSGDLIRFVCSYLNGFRLLTNELYVEGPKFIAISVRTRVEAEPFAAFGAVEAAVEAELSKRLDPQTWPFDLDLVPTALYGVILDAEGVKNVLDLAILVDGLPHEDLTEAVPVPDNGLIYGIDHQITVVEREDL